METVKEKTEYGFNARRRAIDRIGLSEVRNFRIAKLEQEKEAWQQLYDQRKQVTPELSALLILSVSPNLSSG